MAKLETLLDRLIQVRSAEAVHGMVSAAAFQVAETLAKEALADDEFRKVFVEAVRREALAILEHLNTPAPAPEKPNGAKRRR